jgi:Phosphoribosylglycinamide synthetase, ATP-grasp (A) domain
MITPSGPKVLEYNARFGDPETQTLLPLLSPTTDLAEIMLACTNHRLDQISIDIEPKFCVTVVAASGGYPGSYQQGHEIRINNGMPLNIKPSQKLNPHSPTPKHAHLPGRHQKTPRNTSHVRRPRPGHLRDCRHPRRRCPNRLRRHVHRLLQGYVLPAGYRS